MTLARKILANVRRVFNRRDQIVYLRNSGHCPTCDSDTTFVANEPYLRNHYKCLKCGSLPRERALMYVTELFYPNWVDLRIHESSPGGTGASARFKRECRGYIPSQYFPNVVSGSLVNEIRCENLEALSFDDASCRPAHHARRHGTRLSTIQGVRGNRPYPPSGGGTHLYCSIGQATSPLLQKGETCQ